MPLSSETRRRIETLGTRYPRPRSAILPSLWAVQEELGHVTPEGMREVAGILGLAAGEVEGISTFYSMYFQRPPGRHSLVICANVACALRGAEELVEHLEAGLGCPSGGTAADGSVTWERTVECLGACDAAPAAQLDHRTVGELTAPALDALLGSLRDVDA